MFWEEIKDLKYGVVLWLGNFLTQRCPSLSMLVEFHVIPRQQFCCHLQVHQISNWLHVALIRALKTNYAGILYQETSLFWGATGESDDSNMWLRLGADILVDEVMLWAKINNDILDIGKTWGEQWEASACHYTWLLIPWEIPTLRMRNSPN